MELEIIISNLCTYLRTACGFKKITEAGVPFIDHYIEINYVANYKHNPDHLWWIVSHIKHTNQSYDFLVKKAGKMIVQVAPLDKLARPIVDDFIYRLTIVGLRLDVIAQFNN